MVAAGLSLSLWSGAACSGAAEDDDGARIGVSHHALARPTVQIRRWPIDPPTGQERKGDLMVRNVLGVGTPQLVPIMEGERGREKQTGWRVLVPAWVACGKQGVVHIDVNWTAKSLKGKRLQIVAQPGCLNPGGGTTCALKVIALVGRTRGHRSRGERYASNTTRLDKKTAPCLRMALGPPRPPVVEKKAPVVPPGCKLLLRFPESVVNGKRVPSLSGTGHALVQCKVPCGDSRRVKAVFDERTIFINPKHPVLSPFVDWRVLAAPLCVGAHPTRRCTLSVAFRHIKPKHKKSRLGVLLPGVGNGAVSQRGLSTVDGTCHRDGGAPATTRSDGGGADGGTRARVDAGAAAADSEASSIPTEMRPLELTGTRRTSSADGG